MEGRTMLDTNIGKRSMVSMGGLLKFLLLLSVSGDLLPETDLSSSNRTGNINESIEILSKLALVAVFSDIIDNRTTKPPILSIDERSENVEEKKSSMAIFFILMVIAVSTLVVHMLIVSKLYFIPESLAIVILGEFLLNIVIIHYKISYSTVELLRQRIELLIFLILFYMRKFIGAVIGLILSYSKRDWTEVETFSSNIFFLVLLPPIIFENGYNLHKSDFFTNMFPILSFATLGTVISALTIGLALYILGQADLIYKMTIAESFVFGSMISAVDPVATLAIFQALNVERMLYMLVFGESMLNDAVAIVLTSTSLEMSFQNITSSTSGSLFFRVISRFTYIFLISALLGAFVGFLSALLFKYVDLRKTPSLEFALLLIFAYLPYGLAEAISLSGIMAILFCSITMSQYTHFNISPITQITMQQTFRTLAFVAETCTFAYLGLALFTIKLQFQPMFVLWSILLCFIGRAFNVFPLAYITNKCRRPQISMKNQFIMWYSMRGAVAFALALHISIENEETKRVLLTTTLFIVLFTIIFLGGTTLPVLHMLSNAFPDRKQRRNIGMRISNDGDKSAVLLSKTQEMFIFDQSEHLTSDTEEIDKVKIYEEDTYKGIAYKFNELFVRPLFVRRYTLQELHENRINMHRITSKILSEDCSNLIRQFSTDEISTGSSSQDQLLL
uniref:Sodium/hydrogen exchanger n=1 Tax=Onchocerca volvulus TaxID=6282 RepID=A0A8R1Y1W8_ONCVO